MNMDTIDSVNTNWQGKIGRDHEEISRKNNKACLTTDTNDSSIDCSTTDTRSGQ